MINNYWFFCVSIVLIGNHALGMDYLFSEWISKKASNQPTSKELDEQINRILAEMDREIDKELLIFEAIDDNDLRKLQEMVKDVDMNNMNKWLEARNYYGTSLSWAVLGNKIEIACYLISMGADVNTTVCEEKFYFDVPVLFCANSIEMIKILVEAGATINALYGKGWGVLDQKVFCLKKAEEVDLALELIKNGAQFHKKIICKSVWFTNLVKNLLGKALLFAFKNNNEKLAQYLFEVCKKKINLYFTNTKDRALIIPDVD